eukprot:TRINITY_DN6619_c3_g1_i1.p1 TRINITY_DN6619_c3_g1~~TRINITY_DN6619_c3_g1_i1.p1  ORF type:complete len:106 (-),score=2.99 TRINITY_DN6619_c3_g1_i1:272-589(-)
MRFRRGENFGQARLSSENDQPETFNNCFCGFAEERSRGRRMTATLYFVRKNGSSWGEKGFCSERNHTKLSASAGKDKAFFLFFAMDKTQKENQESILWFRNECLP